jgi:hypothetical protein
LARIAKTSPELSESDQERAINNAVNDIVRLNILGIYKKIEEPSDLEHENSENTVSLQQNNDLGATTDVGNHPNDI